MNKKIENICGLNNTNETLSDVGNNPDFVFNSDPLYEKVTLFDPEGNKIIVNSWIECAHYVSGGWTNELLSTYTLKNLFIFLCITLLTYFLIKRLFNVYKNK